LSFFGFGEFGLSVYAFGLRWTEHVIQTLVCGLCFVPQMLVCLIITRVSIAVFRDLHTIWCCSFVRSIAKLH
jgi:hypothetical protein